MSAIWTIVSIKRSRNFSQTNIESISPRHLLHVPAAIVVGTVRHPVPALRTAHFHVLLAVHDRVVLVESSAHQTVRHGQGSFESAHQEGVHRLFDRQLRHVRDLRGLCADLSLLGGQGDCLCQRNRFDDLAGSVLHHFGLSNFHRHRLLWRQCRLHGAGHQVHYRTLNYTDNIIILLALCTVK